MINLDDLLHPQGIIRQRVNTIYLVKNNKMIILIHPINLYKIRKEVHQGMIILIHPINHYIIKKEVHQD